MNLRSQALLFAIAVLSATSTAQQRNIRLSSFPSVAVADGRSQISVTAEVRESNGNLVPDGTRISFATTLGSFRDTIVTTSNGLARAILVAGNISGIAKIRASDLAGQSTPAVLEFEFVSDKSQLSSALEYVEISTKDYLEYAYDNQIVWASSPNYGVVLRYRDVQINADDLQLNSRTLEVRAKKARLKIGKVTREFDELNFMLKARTGFGLASFVGYPFPPTLGTAPPYILAGIEPKPDGMGFRLAQKRSYYGFLAINRTKVDRPQKPVDPSLLEFNTFDKSQYTLTAKKATVFPNRQIQFTKADIRIAGEKALSFPLYQLNMNAQQGQLLGENIVSVNNNELAVNYPYFTSLRPGQTSLVRFRTGQSYGRGVNVNRGVFFDYELNWNKGDELQGGLVFSGLGRDDYGLGIRQYSRLNPRTNLSLQLDAPAGRSLFGAASMSQQAPGFNWTLNANGNKNLIGTRNTSQSLNFTAETDPIKVGKLPLRLYYGVRADSSQSSFESLSADPSNPGNTIITTSSYSQQSYGLQFRGVTQSLKINNRNSMQLGFIFNQLNGNNIIQPLTFSGQAILYSNLSRALSNSLTFDYVRDPLSEEALGRYRLTTQSSYRLGNTYANVFANKSLDIDRWSLFSDVSYRLSKRWRLGYQYTLDQQSGASLVDYNIVLGYLLEGREIGLIYSQRTQRIGFQLLNSSF